MDKNQFIKMIESLEIDEIKSADIVYTDFECISTKSNRHLEYRKDWE